MTNTELTHSSFAISMLINTIIDTIKDEYEVSEIEGDAVLMFKRGAAPSQKEIQDTCLKIFDAFHFRRKWMQQHAVCPCKACNQISHLTLKFVAHHGLIGEIKAGGFTKLSGTDVIVAHRLLKNSVPSHEYLLLTEQLLQHAAASTASEVEWINASETYPSIGTVEYRFALLDEKRKATPDPPKPPAHFPTESTAYFEIPIRANYREAYMVLMNIPNRPDWQPGLQKAEQDIPAVYVGSIHRCFFDDYQATISPMHMTVTDEEVVYAESCVIEAMNISLVHEFIFRKVDETACLFSWRLLNAGTAEIPDEERIVLQKCMQEMAKSLKEYCEKMEVSAFQ